MLDVSVYALFLSTDDSIGSNSTGKERIFRIILKVTSGKSTSVHVHGRCVPTGYAHLVSHLTDALAKGFCDLYVPGVGDHYAGRETDGSCSGEVVVDGSRSVTVNGHGFLNTCSSGCLVTADSDHGVHIADGQLIQQSLPLGIIVSSAAKVSKLHAVAGACCGHLICVVVVNCRIIVAVVHECCFCFFRQAEVCRCFCSFFIVCEAVGTGQVCKSAVCSVQFVLSCYCICRTGIVTIVCNSVVYCIDLSINNSVGIGAERNLIITALQNIRLGILIIIGCHILCCEGNRYCLALARLQKLCLCKAYQVSGSFLDTAVGVGRIVVNLSYIFTGNRSCVSNGHIYGDLAVIYLKITHLLLEGGVA